MDERKNRAPSLANTPWLTDPVLQELLTALGRDKARVAGGAVRNALLGEPVADVDIATVHPPDEVMRRAKAAGFSVHPVGLEHGSVVVAGKGGDGRMHAFEVTTLRRDVETYGRHAKVAFTDDWVEDAKRRDFTMNALYCDASGEIFDPLGGLADLLARRVRFIGDAKERIGEDYLRILRFFRFWARYGRGALDEVGLAACADEREGLARISRERVREETHKLLVAPRALDAVRAMDRTGVLDFVVPEECRRDMAALERMVKDDDARELTPDWLLRLAVLCGPCESLVAAFRLSRREAKRLETLRRAEPPHGADEAAWRRTVYLLKPQGALDAARLWHAQGRIGDDAFSIALRVASGWTPPEFPLTGKDAMDAGLAPGPEMGKALKELEEEWMAGDFRADRAALLERLAARGKKT